MFSRRRQQRWYIRQTVLVIGIDLQYMAEAIRRRLAEPRNYRRAFAAVHFEP